MPSPSPPSYSPRCVSAHGMGRTEHKILSEAIVEPYEVELKTETGEILILRGLQRVVGKYDLLRFIFKTASGETRRQTFIEIESKQGGEAGKYGLRRLFLPVRIELPLWRKWLRNGRIFIGCHCDRCGDRVRVRGALPEAMDRSGGGDGPGSSVGRSVLVSGNFDEMVKEFVKETKTIRIK